MARIKLILWGVVVGAALTLVISPLTQAALNAMSFDEAGARPTLGSRLAFDAAMVFACFVGFSGPVLVFSGRVMDYLRKPNAQRVFSFGTGWLVGCLAIVTLLVVTAG